MQAPLAQLSARALRNDRSLHECLSMLLQVGMRVAALSCIAARHAFVAAAGRTGAQQAGQNHREGEFDVVQAALKMQIKERVNRC